MTRRTIRRTALRLERLEPRSLLAAAVATLPEVPVLDAETAAFAQSVARLGQSLGRRQDVFIKVGDSNTADPNYLAPLGSPSYSPSAVPAALSPVLTTYRAPIDGTGANSFNRASTSASPGWALAEALNRAGPEADATNAGLALIMIGSADVLRGSGAENVKGQLRALIQQLTVRGVVPVVCTLPDMTGAFVGLEPAVREYSQAIADVADEMNVPLWNVSRLVSRLPNSGIGDGLHLTTSPNGGGAFGAADLQFGQNARNLEALEVLKAVQDQVFAAAAGPPATAWVPLAAGQRVFAEAPGAGEPNVLTVRDTASGAALGTVLPFGAGFYGGVRAATADVTGDGVPDLIATPGDGGGPVVRVFDGRTGDLAASFFAFSPDFRGGLTVAAGDVDRDGLADIAVGVGAGGGPWVRVFRGGSFGQVGEFLAAGPDDRNGVSVAVGTFAGVGLRIVTLTGGANGTVRMFDFGTGTADVTFPAGDGFSGGETLAVADVNRDGAADVVTAPAAGGGPVLQVFDAATGAGSATVVGDPANRRGLRLATPSGRADEPLLVGVSPGVFVPMQ